VDEHFIVAAGFSQDQIGRLVRGFQECLEGYAIVSRLQLRSCIVIPCCAMNPRWLPALLALIVLLMVCNATAAQQKPNVVIFLSDDQGWGDLSVTGNKNLSTPYIDSIAREGATLDRFFVCAVCSPTRAEFLTGRYHPRTGVRGVSTGQERLSPDEKTIADAFKAAGYATGAFGKWHNGSQWPYHPKARGFDEYYGFTSGHWGEYFEPPLDHNGQPVRGKGYIVDDLTDRALQFIEKNRERPFLCYLPYNTPHTPWSVPEKDWLRFKDKPIEMRAAAGVKEIVDETRCALAMCENIDQNVGRVLKRLDELKLTEDTIVIYFSDNGPNTFRWNGGMKGRKGSVDEGGVRSPFFIRWPGRIAPGVVVSQIAGAIDLLPTLVSLAGVRRVGDKRLDGLDLSPLLLEKAPDWRDRIIFSHQAGRVSARTQEYRLDERGALFNMVSDPGQTRDIAGDKPDVAQHLKYAVHAWRSEVLSPGKDDRPFPVGYAEFPRTPLPARDGVAHGGVMRSSKAPNSSYFVNWNSPEDSITWDVEVATAGRYDVEIQYTCPTADIGSVVEMSFLGSRLTGEVTPGWDPPLYTNQDTLPRPPAESRMKEFRTLRFGTINLEKGRGLLKLRAREVPGRSVMDLRAVVLTLAQ
jgi:arylsulfatase A-like enzyme